MKVLVSNLGSTSFKYKVFSMPDEQVLAQGGMDRIGGEESMHKFQICEGEAVEQAVALPDHAAAIDEALARLAEGGVLASVEELDAVGFKAVHARSISGVVELDADVIGRMEDFYPLAPAHNPAYVAAIQQFERVAPAARRIGCFETAFHGTMPHRRKFYAVPYEWYEKYGVQRYGFHGASHRYAAEKVAELEGRADLKHVNMHLGGSSSLCAVMAGVSQGASHGLSPQGGLPQNNRIGDLDPYALDLVMRNEGRSFAEVLDQCANEGGLLGISGYNDVRDIQEGAAKGDARCQLAIDVLATSARDWLGSFVVEMGGLDAVSFTGGIGEYSVVVREAILRDLEFLGVEVDQAKNEAVQGEGHLHTESSRVHIHVLCTDEELVVARQTCEFLALEV